MSFKAKTVLNNDIRVFKQDINTMDDAFEVLQNFVKEKYELQESSFIIQYEDEEKDLITIGSSDDLQEAYRQAGNSGSVLKLLIVPENSDVVYAMTTEVDKSEVENDNEKEKCVNEENGGNIDNEDTSSSSSSDEEHQNSNSGCAYEKLIEDLSNNKEFRDEFINFITTFVVTLQDNLNQATNDAFKSSLNAHENVSKHPSMQKLIEMFPVLLNQFQPLLAFICKIDADNVAECINNLINVYGGQQRESTGFMNFGVGLLPMLMQLLGNGANLFAPPPPPPHHGHDYHQPPPHHGYGHGHGHNYHHPPPHHGYGHGHGHGHDYHHSPPHHHGYGHGPHQPPPPPPPPFNPIASLLSMFGNLNNNNSGETPFGQFVYPPPPHAFHGHHGPHHQGHHNHHGPHHQGPHHQGHHGKHGKKFGKGRCPYLAKHCGEGQANKEESKCARFKHCKSQMSKGRCYGKNVTPKWCQYSKKNKEFENEDYRVDILKDDITFADKSYVLPGQVVVKTWRIRNVGKKEIPDGTTIKYYGKPFNPIINGVSFSISSLQVGKEADVSVVVQAPKEEDGVFGKQKATFKLVLSNGVEFGPVFHVRFFIAKEDGDTKINNDNDNDEEEKKSDDNNDKELNNEEKKKAKLLKQRAKLEQKVAKLDAKLANNNDLNDDLNDIYVNKNDDNKTKSPIVIEQSEPLPHVIINENEISAHDDQNNDNKKDKASSESPNSWNEVIVPPVDDMVIDEPVEEQPLLSSNIVSTKDDNNYKYKEQLKMLLSMGFDDVENIKKLLNSHNGNVDAIVNILFS